MRNKLQVPPMPERNRTDALAYLLYSVVNPLGLNRPYNLLIHKLGIYPTYAGGRCMWCGEKHKEKGIVSN